MDLSETVEDNNITTEFRTWSIFSGVTWVRPFVWTTFKSKNLGRMREVFEFEMTYFDQFCF